MKKSFSTLALISGIISYSVIVTSCSSKAKQEQTEENNATKSDSTQMVYACSMHPDITGKKGDKCSKCGMDLEEVKKSDSTDHHH